MRFGLFVATIAILLFPNSLQAQAQPGVLLAWDDTLMVQPLGGAALVTVGRATAERREQLGQGGLDVYRLADSPVIGALADGYGFHHGVWSPDQGQFAYLAIAPDASGYRVVLWADGAERVLLTDTVTPQRGYLDPLGWSAEGSLLLLERTMLYNLTVARVWRYDPSSGQLQAVLDRQIPPLSGNSAMTPDGTQAFIGFDTTHQQGYMVDVTSLDLMTFRTDFALPAPPKSVFETYPVEVLGIHTRAAWPDLTPVSAKSVPVQQAPATPWLHWPLPDGNRRITCYPDSAWTAANFEFTCAGLASPRQYPGHQGTDVGGRPNGLEVGTPVHAAATGIVIRTFTSCQPNDVGCNDAYGNSVLMEHTRVINSETQTWYTGYSHLSEVRVAVGTAISDIQTIIALSGDTGLGGPHLHFEVRYPHGGGLRWVDPWVVQGERNLWVGENDYPTSAAGAVVVICRTSAGNNVRVGPGTAFDAVTQTQADVDYRVLQTEFIETGSAQGEWYQIGQDGVTLGWVWSGLMENCEPIADS